MAESPQPGTIAVLGGTGPEGSGLALRWVQAGLHVIIGSRDAARAKEAAERIRERLGTGLIEGDENAAAVAHADTIVLTVPFSAQQSTLKGVRGSMRAGQTLVDVTVPLETTVGGRATRVLGVWQGSAAEAAAEAVPEGVLVAAAFHNVSAVHLEHLAEPLDCDVLVCGDKRDAKSRVQVLVEAIQGARFVDAGPLSNARTVEAITALLIGMNIRYKIPGGGNPHHRRPRKARWRMTANDIRVIPLAVEGEIAPGADLAELIVDALKARAFVLEDDDVVVITQKAVSKAEGRLVNLADVEPSPFAVQFAQQFAKDARQVEIVLRESRRIVKMDRGIIVSETHHGFVCANAGVDASNVGSSIVSLLPVDPDASAYRIRGRLGELAGTGPAVIITDTFGRPWRNGLTNVAIGVAGLDPLHSYAGQRDPFGYELRVTVMAWADELASAAELVMGKTDGVPFALVRGFSYERGAGTARDLVRDAAEDMFR